MKKSQENDEEQKWDKYYRFTQPDVTIPIRISTGIRMNRRHIQC